MAQRIGKPAAIRAAGTANGANPVSIVIPCHRGIGADGSLTGGLVGGITDSGVKRKVLLEEAASIGSGTVSLATGDGANDIPMLVEATYGLAYCAKPKARAAADGWVDRGDLTGVLELLGIPRDEWVWE